MFNLAFLGISVPLKTDDPEGDTTYTVGSDKSKWVFGKEISKHPTQQRRPLMSLITIKPTESFQV